ncbi:MAG: hypothetical protein A3G81_32965 [Betaproteobacteria bacterium RIFCSPLOWO2_12_FULL_65_14]|nr:MAG: hypothetical protein A3G81_32965 [Betaproteobacteria bacterium RIFCSPLOWO2_12_FULL_65_14]
MAMAMNTRFTIRPDVIFRALGAEAILLNLDGGLYFGLNEVGTRIWMLLADHDGEGVSQALTREFDVTIDEARADVSSLIGELIDRGLLAPADALR